MKYKQENNLNNWDKLRQGKQLDDQAAAPLRQIWEGSSTYGEEFQPDVEGALSRLKGRIAAEQHEARVVTMPARSGWLRKVAAVAILAVATVAMYFALNNDSSPTGWTTIQTAANEIREVILPDGSTISLNENTSLAYNNDLNTADERRIELEGEAFFDVKRRPEQAFVIRTPRAEVKVLGTSFNVRALPGTQRTEVEVSTGKVAVTGLKTGEKTVLLEASDAVIVSEQGYDTFLDNNSPLNSSAWRTGELSFRGSDLATALNVIERTYGVDLRWDTNTINGCTITGNWATESFTDVLLILEGITGLNIQDLGGKVYQLSGSCQ